MDVDDHNALLLFRVGPVCCCAPSRPVTAVVTPPPLHHPPGSDALHPGVFRHVAGLVRVLDLRVGFGTPAEEDHPSRIIVAELDDGLTGFRVDDILDVITWPDSGWGNLPPLLPRRLFRGTLERAGRLCLYSDFVRLAGITAPGILHGYLQTLAQPAPSSDTENRPPDNASTRPGERPRTEPGAQARPTPASAPPKRPEPRTAATPPPAAPRRPPTAGNDTVGGARARPSASAPSRPPRSAPERRKAAPAVRERTAPRPVAGRPPSSADSPSRPATRPPPERPADTQPPPAATTPAAIEPPPEGSFAVVLLVLLLIGTGIGGWLGLSAWQPDEPAPALVAKFEPQASGPASPPNPARPETPAPPATPAIPDMADTLPAPADPSPPMPSSSEYRAEIRRDTRGITLVLHQPRTEPIAEPATGGVPPAAPATETASAPLAASETPAESGPAPRPETPAPAPRPPVQREIIHIVVKGDTLWDIAARYVHDPFRYPELARLSRIRNPDLIYPGDRVRILLAQD